jgi:hypothetical protein
MTTIPVAQIATSILAKVSREMIDADRLDSAIESTEKIVSAISIAMAGRSKIDSPLDRVEAVCALVFVRIGIDGIVIGMRTSKHP